jgi:hypothetical protein
VQREILLAQMNLQLDEAEREADEETERFVKAIREVNQRMGREAVVSQRVQAFDPDAKKNSN